MNSPRIIFPRNQLPCPIHATSFCRMGGIRRSPTGPFIRSSLPRPSALRQRMNPSRIILSRNQLPCPIHATSFWRMGGIRRSPTGPFIRSGLPRPGSLRPRINPSRIIFPRNQLPCPIHSPSFWRMGGIRRSPTGPFVRRERSTIPPHSRAPRRGTIVVLRPSSRHSRAIIATRYGNQGLGPRRSKLSPGNMPRQSV